MLPKRYNSFLGADQYAIRREPMDGANHNRPENVKKGDQAIPDSTAMGWLEAARDDDYRRLKLF